MVPNILVSGSGWVDLGRGEIVPGLGGVQKVVGEFSSAHLCGEEGKHINRIARKSHDIFWIAVSIV